MAGFERGSRGYRRMLGALFLAGIATFAQLYAPQAVLPLIARSFRVDATASALSISAATVGLAIGVIPWSLAGDRIGRARAMSIALVAATVLGVLAPLTPAFPLFLAGRVLEGLFLGGVPALAIAYLSEEISAAHSARAAGTYVAGTTIGGLLGRIVAGPLADLAGWRTGVLVVIAICACATAGFIALAPRPTHAPRLMRTGATDAGLGRTLAVHLRSPRQLALYAQAFLLMGGFVAMYNYLGFRLERHPFSLPASLIALVFLAYLAGTWSSAQAGALATRLGRRAVLLGSVAVMAAGVAITLVDVLWVVLVGLVVATAGFFGAHAIASGWTGHDAAFGRGQAAALYNLAYYAGSSLFGWLGGFAFVGGGWPAAALLIGGLAVLAGAIALTLPRRV
ncbi:MFS transporter [Gryllotalpicola koreensis]|uniref:MFS transporter n=1 Tax=Gryllotalpicola koreensis TaxID=993086 RepID=A0ABP8A6V8_9MICO